jgi:hypothetical protein
VSKSIPIEATTMATQTVATTPTKEMGKFQKSGTLTMWREGGKMRILFEWDDYSGPKSKHKKMPITAEHFSK